MIHCAEGTTGRSRCSCYFHPPAADIEGGCCQPVTQGHALSVGEERKRAAHSEACHAVGVTFIPMVVEALGGWGRRQLSPSRSLDGFRASDWEFTPPKPPDTFFSGWPLICGGATPPSGFVASPFDHRRWTD